MFSFTEATIIILTVYTSDINITGRKLKEQLAMQYITYNSTANRLFLSVNDGGRTDRSETRFRPESKVSTLPLMLSVKYKTSTRITMH